jgi:hypothetical protein
LRRRRGLRIKAIYSVGELASAAGIERRHLRRLLEQAGVELMTLDKGYYVSLADLEMKVRSLWEGIKAAVAFGRGFG